MTTIPSTLHLATLCFLLWVLIVKLFRDYRVDALRDRLFTIREELFDYAADGEIAFDAPAYGSLRQFINSLIRFAHRLTLARAIAGVWAFWRLSKKEPTLVDSLGRWTKALEEQPEDVRRRLIRIHSRVIGIVFRHMAIGAPILFTLLCLFVVIRCYRGTAKGATAKVPGIELWEAQVIEEDRAERHEEEVFV